MEDKDGKIVLTPSTEAFISSLRGKLKTPEGEKTALDILKKERKADS